ncbi:MAG: hypothetical protein LUG27_10175 [Clostridiales bacterium]|nr:hypothetical protein [Clostridiales bacterium]
MGNTAGCMIWRISSAEFRQWLRNSRLIILAVMAVFIHVQVVAPLAECADLMGEPVSVLEGFIALSNSGVVLLVLPLLFLVLLADFPQKSGIHLFYQIRCEKKIWIAGQVLFAVKASLFVVGVLFWITCLMMMGCGTWQMGFSDAMTHFTSAYPDRTGDYVVELVPGNLYQQMSLPEALVHSFFLLLLHFIVIAMILLAASLCNQKYAGVLINAFLLIMGVVFMEVKMKGMWLFPITHIVPWVHYEEYLSEMVFPMWGSYVYLAAGSIGLIAVSLIVSRRYRVL